MALLGLVSDSERTNLRTLSATKPNRAISNPNNTATVIVQSLGVIEGLSLENCIQI